MFYQWDKEFEFIFIFVRLRHFEGLQLLQGFVVVRKGQHKKLIDSAVKQFRDKIPLRGF